MSQVRLLLKYSHLLSPLCILETCLTSKAWPCWYCEVILIPCDRKSHLSSLKSHDTLFTRYSSYQMPFMGITNKKWNYFFFNIYFIIFNHVYDYGSVGLYACVVRSCKTRGFRFPGAGVIGSCQPPDVGPKNRTQILCRNRTCF